MEDLISIVVPVYNAEKYIGKTIETVLKQSYQNFELLLIDDGSTDASISKMKTYTDTRIRLIPLQQGGCAARARNQGITMAKGRYLAFLDADDVWCESKLKRTLDFMKEKDAAFVFTSYEFGDADAVGTGKVVRAPQTLSYREALSRTVIFTSTVMFDLHKLNKESIFMPEVKSEDTATWWRILRSGITAYGLDENLVIYRRAGQSLSSNKLEAIRRIWSLYRNQEQLGWWKSLTCLAGWAVRAVARRI